MTYKNFTDWAEVWGLLIPFIFLFIARNKAAFLKPVRYYVILAMPINILSELIQKYKKVWHIPKDDFFYSNLFLYNLHALLYFFTFAWFFNLLQRPLLRKFQQTIPWLFAGLVLINFIFFEDFFNRYSLNSVLLAVVAGILLFYCLLYYFSIILDDSQLTAKKQPALLIVVGLTFYVAGCFFVFLFYDSIVLQNSKYATQIWDVHNFFYIFLCVCIAITFYRKNEQ